MTTAMLVTTADDLARALAATRRTRRRWRSAWLLVASMAEVAEFDDDLIVGARRAAAAWGVPVVHLNEVIQPRHPLGLRRADLGSAEFIAACLAAGAPAPPSRLACVGEPGPTARTLAGLLGLAVIPIDPRGPAPALAKKAHRLARAAGSRLSKLVRRSPDQERPADAAAAREMATLAFVTSTIATLDGERRGQGRSCSADVPGETVHPLCGG